ncbi:MAG: membrane integrity-associated transporter subunit PqiC [Alphaproteobacteria bacterium]|nr:membrane integrity-associated transporter subunit PqiC [Alphaproteobacteria bacterium]
MKKIVLFALFLLLSACRSPQSQFYVMNGGGSEVVSEKTLNLAVMPVKVPDLLDKAQMVVYDKDSSEVKILEFHRWAEVLPDILQSAVTDNLMAYLPQSYVERTTFGSASAQYSVNIEINRMQAYLGDKVILSAWWSIKDKSGHVIQRKQGVYTATATGDSVADLVQAETAAVRQMSREIAEALAQVK